MLGEKYTKDNSDAELAPWFEGCFTPSDEELHLLAAFFNGSAQNITLFDSFPKRKEQIFAERKRRSQLELKNRIDQRLPPRTPSIREQLHRQ